MKRLLVLLLASVLILPAAPSAAQETDFSCTLESLQDAINIFIGELGKLRTETDPVIIADMLQQLANGANARRAACDNLIFSGDANTVVGPVIFPAGIYKAIGSANANGIRVILTVLEGECGQGTSYFSDVLFNVENGETVFGSNECTAIMEVKMYGEGQWNLRFERL